MRDHSFEIPKIQPRQPKTKLPRLLFFLSALLVVFQVIASNRLATLGMQIADIDSEIQTLTLENNDLRQQIASGSALMTIQKKAKDLGFTKTAQPVYISKDLPVALELR